MIEEHTNRALYLAEDPANFRECVTELIRAIELSAGGHPSIKVCKMTIVKLFEENPAIHRQVLDGISSWIMEFDQKRYAEPSTVVGPMSSAQRDQLAEIILSRIFEL